MAIPKAFALTGILIAALGVLIAFWPTSYLGECPFLAQSGQFGDGEGHGGWALRDLIRYAVPYTAGRRWLDGRSAEYDADGMRLFDRSELHRYDGSDPALPILLGINGDLFDVTDKGYDFYAPGRSYHCFAGKDSSRALALGSLSDDDLERGGDVSDFTPEQMTNLVEQHQFYLDKYPLAGRLKDFKRPTPAAV